MIDLVKKFFGKIKQNDSAAQPRERVHDVRIATCALFLEMANIDGEFSDSEKMNILSILKDKYDLQDENADALMEASKEELRKSIDLWRFTKLINDNYSQEEKKQIVEMLWTILYADGNMDKHEDYLVHKLANLLNLSHKELIDTKLKILHGDGQNNL